MEKIVFGVEDVMELMGVSRSKAYRVIRQLNLELNELGYRTVAGKVNQEFLLERYGYGRDKERL